MLSPTSCFFPTVSGLLTFRTRLLTCLGSGHSRQMLVMVINLMGLTVVSWEGPNECPSLKIYNVGG